jgi:hypothetical protein
MIYFLLIKEEKKGRNSQEAFSRADMPYWLCHARIFLAIGAIPPALKDSP